MLNKHSSFFALGLLCGLLISLLVYAFVLRDLQGSQTQGEQQVRSLKMGHGLPVTHPVHQGLEHMKARLQHYSQGRLSMDIYPSGVLGSEIQSIEQLQQGVLTMTKTSAAALESFVDDMKVFGLPYLFRDRKHYWQVLDSELGEQLLNSLSAKKLQGLAYFDSGSRSFYSKDKAILSPDDLIGLKIRVMNSRMAIDVVEQLGAKATPIAWGELYTALAQGTVDGAENNAPSYVSNRHYEVAGIYSLDEHTSIPDLIIISQDIWQSLSKQEQTWLRQAAHDASLYQRDLWQQASEQALTHAQEQGVSIYQPDKAPFIKQVQAIYQSIEGTRLAELANDIKAHP
ncbi:TRAP transporter substrate-binding protein [Agaribacterium sp. ZY112]|uniref:TRAP transporter substrate-binding protein n=1 Tax=Agaribacterium sp. ZY112 TaxID=3233574 RepID=UPI0035237D80